MSKCGSSALQVFLSSPAFEKATNGRCAYLALHADGKLWRGDPLIEHAASSPRGYCSSHLGDAISAFTPNQKQQVRRLLNDLSRKYDTLILSCEGWGQNPQRLTDDCIFADDAFHVEVLAYVRPQLEWINSAWWQWGAWTALPAGQWINRQRRMAQWDALARQWAAKPWVKKIDVRLIDGDVVQDFMHYLGFQVPAQPRVNQSLPGILLRVLQHNRQLRAGPHDSAIDFVLARHLQLDAGGTPWILGPRKVEELLAFFRHENEQLANRLSSEQRETMLDDPRWWQAEPYLLRPVAKPVVERLDVAQLEQLTVATLEAINRLDAELRACRSGASSS
jgi:hypothetical protein